MTDNFSTPSAGLPVGASREVPVTNETSSNETSSNETSSNELTVESFTETPPTPTPTPTPTVEVPTPPTPPKVESPKFPNGSRNYTRFPSSFQTAFKRLSNSEFAEAEKAFDETISSRDTALQQLKEAQEINRGERFPMSWQEHPDAYRLSPAYIQASSYADRAAFEAEHWRDQLVRIKSGQDWFNLKGYDKSGSPAYEKQAAPEDGQIDVQAEIGVQGALQEARGLTQQALNTLEGIKANFAQNHQGFISNARAMEDRLFPGMKDKGNPYEKSIEYFHGLLPEQGKNHPFASWISKGFALVTAQRAELESLRKELASLKGLKSVKTVMSGELNGEGREEKTLSLSDFMKDDA